MSSVEYQPKVPRNNMIRDIHPWTHCENCGYRAKAGWYHLLSNVLYKNFNDEWCHHCSDDPTEYPRHIETRKKRHAEREFLLEEIKRIQRRIRELDDG